MKRNVKIFLYQRRKKIAWDDDTEYIPADVLENWPDLGMCVESYYRTNPGMKQYRQVIRQPAKYKYTARFLKTLDRYCATKELKLKVIDAMTKIVYSIPCGGLRDAPIKEKPGLQHFYISASWRVFYRKSDDWILFDEFCPHKKAQYYRRS